MLAIGSTKLCRWNWLLVDGKQDGTESGESNNVLVIANIGVDRELHVGMAGIGVPQMNIFWIMTTSHMRTKSPHPNLEMKRLRPGGRMRTTVRAMDNRVALEKSISLPAECV